MYLRGIQYLELESIMQFIYLGKATFYEERMDELLAVAKLLEIKALCHAETESNAAPDDELPPDEQDTSTGFVQEQTVIPDNIKKQEPQERHERVVSVHGKYECDQCDKKYSSRMGLWQHKQTVHQGVKYACDHCDHQATTQGHLKKHIQSKHEGVKYACDQCEQQLTTIYTLRTHIDNKHRL